VSWHFSQALEGAFSEASSLDGEQSAPLSMTGTDAIASSLARTRGRLSRSLSGMTSERSTGCPGGDVLTWYLAGFPAKPIPRRLRERTLQTISGRKCGESWQRQLPGTYLQRTLVKPQSTPQRTTSSRWVTKPAAFPFQRRTWVLTTFGPDIGYVHTPTTKANYAATSMQKWPACREFVRAFGRPSPEVHEWLMGWPEGWSDIQPLETGKFQSWLQLHGVC
jgi:hypothetical protein